MVLPEKTSFHAARSAREVSMSVVTLQAELERNDTLTGVHGWRASVVTISGKAVLYGGCVYLTSYSSWTSLPV